MDVYEYATIPVTPASATRNRRLARKRAAELEDIERQGWEIVSTEPERIFRRGDKITVRRAKTESPELVEAVTRRAGTLWGRFVEWWDGLSQSQQIGVGLAAIAVLVTAAAAF
jgi:hypothetical protein